MTAERLRCPFCERLHDWPNEKASGAIPCACGAVAELLGEADPYAPRPQDIGMPDEIADDLSWKCVNVPEIHYIEHSDEHVVAYWVDWVAPRTWFRR